MDKKQLKAEINDLHVKQRQLINYMSERTKEELLSQRISYDFTISSYSYDACRTRHPHSVGIYLFEADLSHIYMLWESTYNGPENKKMNSWFDKLGSLWGSVQYSPKFYSKRARLHYSLSEEDNRFRNGFIPFYLGKSKNVFERINNHHEGYYEGTYGLRLRGRGDFENVKFRVTSSDLSGLDHDDLYPMVGEVEKQVRLELEPIIGKQ